MISINNDVFDSHILAEGCTYTIGLSDGRMFKKSVFVGIQQSNGKAIMVFETKDKKQLTINPSFHSFTLEEETEMNDYLAEQAKKSWDK